MSAPDRFTIVVAPTNAAALEAIRRYARLGDTVQLAGVQASIEAACFGSAIDQLTTTEKRLEELNLGITPPTLLSHGERLLLSLSIALANQSRTAAEVAEARERLYAAHKAEQAARECADKISIEVFAHAEQLGKTGTEGLASPAQVDKDRVNQIAETGENVNRTTENSSVVGLDPTLAKNAMVQTDDPASSPIANIDYHVRMAADARRYRHLRDRERIEDADTDLLVTAGDVWFSGEELDTEIDNAIRLAVLLERHGEEV